MTIATRTLVRRAAGLVLAVVAFNACKDTAIPDLNNPSLEGIITNPTRAQVGTMARGILDGNRTSQAGFIRDLEIIGRDAYNLDGSDPRWVTELLINLDPGGFGARHWGDRYRNVKSADVLIAALATSSWLDATEKSATVGFAQTFNVLYQQRTSDVNTMFKVFRRSCLDTLQLSSDGFELDIELVCKLVRAGHAPLEVPVNYAARDFSQGKKIRFWRDACRGYAAFFKYRWPGA